MHPAILELEEKVHVVFFDYWMRAAIDNFQTRVTAELDFDDIDM